MATRIRKNLHESDVHFEYEVAIDANNVRRLKTLVRHKLLPPQNCLYQAVMCKHKNLLPILLDAGADPNYFVNRYWTIMGECIEKSDAPTLKLVLSRGADPNLSYKGLHSIIYASRVGDIEVFRMLVEAGARLFVDPLVAPNALFEAVGRGHKEIVAFLIERGVKFNSRKPFGKTAIEFAEQMGMTEIRDYLRACKSEKRSRTRLRASRRQRI